MSVYLKELTVDDGKPVYDMLQGIERHDNGFSNQVREMAYDEFAAWLELNADMAKGIGLESWMVPMTTYWLYNGGVPVGCGRIRHYMNDHLRDNGGLIGYAISLEHRGMGYGNEILGLLIKESRKLGIGDIQLCANCDNERSNRIIRRYGGELVRDDGKHNFYLIYAEDN